MLSFRRFVRLIPSISKQYAQGLKALPLLKPTGYNFSEQSKKPSQQEMEKVKQDGKNFYQSHVEDIMELEKYQDWQQIVGSCSETLLIDFYADWCGPCKKLTPKLEQKVKQSGGKLKLLKINIDNFGKIAQTFQIKAVPTVYMVYQGKAVDMFSGEFTDEQLDKFLQTAGRASQADKELEKVGKALEEAKGFLNSHDYAGAEKTLLEIKYSKVPQEYKFVGDIFLACAYSQLNKMAQLKVLVQVMKVNVEFYAQKPQFQQLFTHLCQTCQVFEKEKEENNEVMTWRKKIEAEPQNLEIRFAGALFYKENQMIEECLEQLLAIVKIDKNWQEKKANKEILAIFKELGNSSPLTQTYRRLLQQALH